MFVAAAELTSAVRDWSPSEALSHPGGGRRGVTLGRVERWDPSVPMEAVLARIGPSETTKADFDAGVVGITPEEYDAALAVAGER